MGGLCERRVRRARAKTFLTSLCKAAAGDSTVADRSQTAAAGYRGTADRGGAVSSWHEDSDTEGPEAEVEGDTKMVLSPRD